MAIEADLEASPWEGATARSGLGFRDIRVARKRVLAPDAREQPHHRCRAVAAIPDEINSWNLMWGTDGSTAGAGSSPPSINWNAECVGWHVCKRGDRFAALRRSPWGLPGCMARPRPARLGGWPCGWITAPSICRTTSPTRSSSYPAVLRLRRRAPDQRRRRAVNRTLKEQIIHGRIRGAAGRRPRLRRTLQCPVDRRKERLPESSSISGE